jgi:tRNA A37 methylthiotransferase MiaB
MKVLFIQFANSMFLRHEDCDGYWDAFYKKYNDIGYWRGEYSFEVPKWIAEIDYLIDKREHESKLLYCKNSLDEIFNEIEEYRPTYTLFSLMDCNKEMIKNVVKNVRNTTFIIGGYNEKYIKQLEDLFPNVIYAEEVKDEARIFGVEYKCGTDYSLFKDWSVVPRLTLSSGCYNHCKFCTIEHGNVTPIDDEIIIQQVCSFKDLKFKLIYLDDKTFGQCKNYRILSTLSKIIKEYNEEFLGFIVQTTSGVLLKKYEDFYEIGVIVAEIGMETYNDNILKLYNKPSNCSLVDKCIEACKDDKIKLILNVVIGFPQETKETYQNTYDLINNTLCNGVIGINPSIYTDYELEDNCGEIDFAEYENTELSREYFNKINNLGKEKFENGS